MSRQQTSIAGGQHSYTRESALEWIAPRWRAELEQMTERRRRETIALARQRAAEHPRSYLAQYLHVLYGVRP